MIEKRVEYIRSDEINDIFKLIWIDTITYWTAVDYAYYPRTMELNENDVYIMEMVD